MQAAFSEATAQAGVAASWRQGEDMPAECVVRHARHSDVLILGQENAGDVEAATGNDFVEQVLLSAGRPVIVLPTAGSFRNAGARVLYCWNQSRESAARSPTRRPCCARQRAARLTLGHGAPADPDLRASFEDLAAYCASHGFPSWSRSSATHESRHRRRHPERGRRFRRGPDRHGAYGHSRTRQWIMGGATRSLLEAMTLPVFFSLGDAGRMPGKEAAVVGLHNAER